MKISSVLLFFAVLLVSGLFFMQGCSSNDSGTSPVTPGGGPAAPTNVNVVLSAISGGGSNARISWTKSTDNSSGDFAGYQVVTNKVDTTGKVLGLADSALVVKSDSSFHIVNLDPSRSTRYQTKVYSVLGDGTRSQAATSVIYAGVYEFTNQTIDEFSSTSNSAKSGFGFDPYLGLGTQLAYSSDNAAKIDLNMRMDTDGALKFFSPSSPKAPLTNGHDTKLSLIGIGQAAYDKAEGLAEPTLSEIAVTPDNVYLIKTQAGNYVKIWVKSVAKASGNNFNTATFDYKLQPFAGLRVLKR
ncbi:MAG TPA: fibronectin type III domain-containing protein [Ignavibacteriales bacterium]|nr:fibronectin type III domain-containing protein [Ignavibacteriales bacterium]